MSLKVTPLVQGHVRSMPRCDRASDTLAATKYLLFSKRIRQVFETEMGTVRRRPAWLGMRPARTKIGPWILAGTLPGHFVSLEELNT